MYRIRKQFKFEAAHRLAHAYSKCCTDTIHGHSYIVEVFIVSESLDAANMVIDFGELKTLIGDLFVEWDHAIAMPKGIIKEDADLSILGSKLIITDTNPTAEWMCREFFETIKKSLSENLVRVEKVRVHESATGWAEYQE